MKVIRTITATFLIFCISFTFLFGAQKIGKKAQVGKSEEYKGIITLWHVDSFEGGLGSRKQFLLKTARTFEKQNKGVLIMVISHTPESVKESMDKGVYPDIISFGNGTEISNLTELNLSKTISGGFVGERLYATAWCRGGYVLIANPTLTDKIGERFDYLLVSEGQSTLPLVAFALEQMHADKIEVKKPMDAYVKFVSGKTPYFLGTQRDVNRLNNRGMEVITRPLSKYNDLYQYVAITSQDKEKMQYAEKFIEHLVSDSVQSELNQIGMLSCYLQVKNENQHLTNMQNVNGFKMISAFTPSVIISELQSFSDKFAVGDENSLNKIKKMLV